MLNEKLLTPQEAYELFKEYVESRNEVVLSQGMAESESYYSISNCREHDFYNSVVYISKREGKIYETDIFEHHPMEYETEVNGRVTYNRYKIINGIVRFDKVVSYE